MPLKEDGQALAVGVPHPRSLIHGSGDDARSVRRTTRKSRDLRAPRETGGPLPPAFHTRTVLSIEAVTMRAPSRLNDAELTLSWCPRSWHAFLSHRR